VHAMKNGDRSILQKIKENDKEIAGWKQARHRGFKKERRKSESGEFKNGGGTRSTVHQSFLDNIVPAVMCQNEGGGSGKNRDAGPLGG